MNSGILSYGHYIPMLRMNIDILAEQWALGDPHLRALKLNGRKRSAINAPDEDAVTLSIEAASRALARAPQGTPTPRSLLIGSESHPYAVKPTSVIVADALGLTPDVFVVDLEFACKGGTAALLLTLNLVAAGQIETGIAIGADCPQSAPGSLLEASVGSGAVAMLVGKGVDVIAKIECMTSASSDTTDFWRRDTSPYPSVVGKFSSEAGYTEHTSRVVNDLLTRTKTTPADYKYVCFHQPYESLALATARKLGFKSQQLQQGLVAGRIGNTYSSACMLSLSSVLDAAQPGDRILVTSFGSGAGSDGFVFTVQPAITAFRERTAESYHELVATQTGDEHTDPLTYGQYAITQGKLRT